MAQLRGLGLPGIAAVTVGAVLVLAAFTKLNWYSGSSQGADSIGGGIDFRTLHARVTTFDAPGISSAYFAWLAWTILIAAILLGFGANLPGRAADSLRVLGATLGAIGAAATYIALHELVAAAGTGAGVFDHAAIGLWLTLAGYLLIAIGAAAGPLPAPRV